MPFAHEQLSVYRKTLDFVRRAEILMVEWPSSHAFVDHLSRAAESVVCNLVEAVRLRGPREKQKYRDYSLGSTLECAACFDIALSKALIERKMAFARKSDLLEIAKMTVGLRKSWQLERVREDDPQYFSSEGAARDDIGFHHERLEAYKLGLSFVRWLTAVAEDLQNERRSWKALDKYATKIVLNVAEGNGRYSVLDQRKFLDAANRAAVKLAAFLDMVVDKGIWSRSDILKPKRLLLSVGALTAKQRYTVGE